MATAKTLIETAAKAGKGIGSSLGEGFNKFFSNAAAVFKNRNINSADLRMVNKAEKSALLNDPTRLAEFNKTAGELSGQAMKGDKESEALLRKLNAAEKAYRANPKAAPGVMMSSEQYKAHTYFARGWQRTIGGATTGSVLGGLKGAYDSTLGPDSESKGFFGSTIGGALKGGLIGGGIGAGFHGLRGVKVKDLASNKNVRVGLKDALSTDLTKFTTPGALNANGNLTPGGITDVVKKEMTGKLAKPAGKKQGKARKFAWFEAIDNEAKQAAKAATKNVVPPPKTAPLQQANKNFVPPVTMAAPVNCNQSMNSFVQFAVNRGQSSATPWLKPNRLPYTKNKKTAYLKRMHGQAASRKQRGRRRR